MDTKFKAGDKVIRINEWVGTLPEFIEKSVYLGEEYTVKEITPQGKLRLKENDSIHAPERFKLKENQIMTNKKIAIKVGKDEVLAQVVLDFLYKKGFKWNKGDTPNYMDQYGDDLAFGLNYYDKKDITFSPFDSKCYEGFIKFNAATQFGELIAALSEPVKPIIKVKNDAGDEYEAKFKKDYVEFGCAKIHVNCFIELNKVIMNTNSNQQSKHFVSIQIGRGLFTPDLIKQIVGHPDFNK